MANNTYCVSCNTCQGCNTCQNCNSCESCNTSCNDSGCNTDQAFCTIGCQEYGEYESFSFSYSPGKDKIMGPGYFDQDVWDEIIKYINKLRAKGSEENSGDFVSLSWTDDVAPFKASEFNRIAVIAGTQTRSSNSIIYGSYFQDLEQDIENAKLSNKACDKCNTGCDVTCDNCQKCNISNTDACGAGQTCNNKATNCESCDTCQNDTPAAS